MNVARLIADGRAAGLRIEVDGDRLVVRGPREAGDLARALLARKVEVMAALTRPPALNWSRHATGDPMPCRLCRRPALMRDAEGRPCHKVCAEQATPTIGGAAA